MNKNEKYGSSNMSQQYTEAKPKFSPMQGFQYAGNPADGSVSPDPLSVTYDQWNNEQASDPTMHQNCTPGVGSYNFSGGQYSDDWNGGYSNYGVTVNSPTTSNSSTTVDVSRADRGKES